MVKHSQSFEERMQERQNKTKGSESKSKFSNSFKKTPKVYKTLTNGA